MQPDVVETLENMLEAAKAGQINALVAIVYDQEMAGQHVISGDIMASAIVYQLEVLKKEIIP